MTPSEIILADSQAKGLNGKGILLSIKKMIESGEAKLLQQNDSVLVLKKIGQNAVELHLFTKDKPMTLVKSLMKFIDTIRSSDLDAVYGDADNQQIIGLLRNLGVEVVDSDIDGYNWKALV